MARSIISGRDLHQLLHALGLANSNSAYPVADCKFTCAPSLGDLRAFQAKTFGTGGKIVAAGDMLKARVTVANHDSAHGMNGSVRVWFSTDPTLCKHEVMSPTEPAVRTYEPIVLANLKVEVPPGGPLLTARTSSSRSSVMQAPSRCRIGFPLGVQCSSLRPSDETRVTGALTSMARSNRCGG